MTNTSRTLAALLATCAALPAVAQVETRTITVSNGVAETHPVANGIEAMQEIRKRPELRDLPIIALTAKAMPDDQQRCLAAGANDYITKPIDVDRLVSLCRVWLSR